MPRPPSRKKPGVDRSTKRSRARTTSAAPEPQVSEEPLGPAASGELEPAAPEDFGDVAGEMPRPALPGR